MTIEDLWLEIIVILALILANGFFAASEIAMIAVRKSRIDALLEKGYRSAAAVARLKNDPDRFLATVQIGVTVVSSFASAIGGALIGLAAVLLMMLSEQVLVSSGALFVRASVDALKVLEAWSAGGLERSDPGIGND